MSCHLQMVSDDSATAGRFRGGEESENRAAISDFASGCVLNHMKKNGELVVDRWRTKSLVVLVSIHGVNVDTVDDDKYLGVHIENKLDCAEEHQGDTGFLQSQ